jgi:outer membrane protein
MNVKTYSLYAFAGILSFLSLSVSGQDQTPTPQYYSLEACRNTALENNRKIKAAKFEIEAARAAQKSVDANAYPSLSGTAQAVYLGPPLGGAFGGMIPKFSANAMISISQPVYAGGKIRYGKEASAKVTSIREEQHVMTETEVRLAVEKAYWQVVQVNEKIILATRYREMLQSLQKDLKDSYDAGLIYKNDLLRVEVSLNEAELNLTQARDGLVMARLNLAQIMGLPGQTSFILTDSVTGDFSVTIQLASADNRPEIRMLQRSIEAEELQHKILKADQRPTLGIGVSGVAVAGSGVNFEDGGNFLNTYFGVASLSIPIYEWGKHANKVKEQSYKISARRQEAEETRELIDLEIQQGYLQLHHAAKKVELSMLSLQQAGENLRLADDRFKAGTVVGKDLQEAQAIWQEAYSKLIDAKVEFKISEVSYKKATGELH